jgi:hypothetical protein
MAAGSCRVRRQPQGPLWIFDAAEAIVRGMSGSPIRADDGSAIGLVCVGSEHRVTESGPHPALTHNLPAWLRDELLSSADLEAQALDEG